MSLSTKIYFFSSIVLLFIAFLSFSSPVQACNIFDLASCNSQVSVDYCNSNDPTSSKYCSLDRGTQIVSGNINDIEKNRKFSVYIQDVIAYLLVFLGIVGVIYIIYAGFNVVTAGGDEDKVKKSKQTIFHVIIGLILIFLAYSIVKFFIGSGGTGGVLNNAFNRLPSFIETTYAYTEYDLNTFDNYKKQIELLSSTLDREYQVNNQISAGTLGTLSSLVKSSMETFPDSDNIIFNTNLANSLLTAIELVKKAPDSDTNIINLAKSINDYLTKIKINRIKGKITASPEKGNAPLVTTLRASEVVDPSGVTIPKESYIWWIRSAGGQRTILGTGPSIAYTFPEERTYTVFLNILSSSRNKNGKTDILPFDSSINVNVLPKLGNISISINGIYVSNLDKIKFTPAQGRLGLLIDATASVPATGTKFVSTRFEFGNGTVSQYNGSPSLDRQIYANEGIYKMRMEVTTNENQKIIKELDIEIRDPISSIRSDKLIGFPRDEFRFNAFSSAAYSNLGYAWQIVSLEDEKTLFSSSLQNISYKFPRIGKYAVKLKTFASNGKEDFDTLIVTIEGHDPIASFDAKPASTETPNTFVLDATKSYDPDNLDKANFTYVWTIDGVRTDLSNSTRNGAMGKYTFDTIGTHRIFLEISNKEGKTASYNKELNINSLLSVNLITSPKIVKAGSSISIIADSKDAQAFEWQFGDGQTDTSTTGRMNHIYKKAGIYSVNVTVHGRNSDTNSIIRKVYVTDSTSPFAIITLKRDADEIIPTPDACDGKEAFVIDRAKTTTISAENSINTDGTNQGITYTWKYGTKNSSQKNFSYKFDELGCFPVTLTVRSQKTGAQNTTQTYVKVENIASRLSSLTVTSNNPDADPVLVTVTADNAVDEDGAIASYIWYYYTEEDPEPQDFRITKTPKTVFVLPRIGAKYYFAVILEDSNGLRVNSDDMSTQRYFLTLASDNINTPIITLKASNTSISSDEKIDFSVTAKNILGTDIADKAEYKWDYNGDGIYEETTNTPRASHIYSAPGNFNFKVKVTYKGISNTKYQAITVKNEIHPNLEYIAIGKKFIFLNTTKGFYTKVQWSLGGVTSTTPDSFIYDFGENTLSGDIRLEVSDGTNTKDILVTPRKDILNALKAKKSTDKLIYFSYPSIDSDVVHIQNSSEKLYLYLGESQGTIAKYGIDTDITVDSDLNGDATDDMDNKGTDSSINGSVFVVKSSDIYAKEKTMRLSLYDVNNTVIATKDIKVVYDFITSTVGDSFSGSTVEVLPNNVSESDKANLEKLKNLIRDSKEQDRLKMMQYFSQLQENWFDSREKTKTIIDFENYIDTSAALDSKEKDVFYSLLEGFLLADTQVKDDIGLATQVLKSLIPKTNSSYDQIIKNIDDIISHPTNTTLNKELGVFILNAIKDDTTIEVKDKNIIKSQLQTIIYGGQDNIPANTPVDTATSSGGILNFIIGFGKILGIIILLIIGVIIFAFIYFKISNKDDNIGFQDFIIDKISGKKPTEKPMIQSDFLKEVVLDEKKESPLDVLVNIPSTIQINDSITTNTEEVVQSNSIEESSSPVSESATIPDWLKESTSIVSNSDTKEDSIADEQNFSSSVDEIQNNNTSFVVEDTASPSESTLENESPAFIAGVEMTNDGSSTDENISVPSESSEMPDWLKGVETTPTTEETVVPEETHLNEDVTLKEPELPTPEQNITTDSNIASDLPPWMQGINQDSLKEEVEEEISMPSIKEEDMVSSYEDIPDWLKSTASLEVSADLNTVLDTKIPQEMIEDSTIISSSKETKIKEKSASSKKKPAVIVSESPVISANPDDLPDWLK